MASLEAVAIAYGRSVYEKVLLLRADLSGAQLSLVRRAINKDIRHFHDVVLPDLLVPLTSRRAVEHARVLGVDLCRQTWLSQPTFDTGRAKGAFHLEHLVTVDSQVDGVIDADCADGAVQVLLASRLAWILKSENIVLTERFGRRSRPDPEQAYRDAGIDLVTCCERPVASV